MVLCTDNVLGSGVGANNHTDNYLLNSLNYTNSRRLFPDTKPSKAIYISGDNIILGTSNTPLPNVTATIILSSELPNRNKIHGTH